jgi:hypothetical protein
MATVKEGNSIRSLHLLFENMKAVGVLDKFAFGRRFRHSWNIGKSLQALVSTTGRFQQTSTLLALGFAIILHDLRYAMLRALA